MHSLIWLDGAPNFRDDGFVAFVDRNTKCSLDTPLKAEVLKYQSHHHTATCFNRNVRCCRFSFPKPPQIDTTINLDSDTMQSRGRTVSLRRAADETYINNYHPQLLDAVRSNMDIQVRIKVCKLASTMIKHIQFSIKLTGRH